MKLSITIVIPTYNGLDLFKKHFSSVVRFAANYPIIVIDDASTDSTQAWIKSKYPKVTFVKNQNNLGFALSVNKGFALAKTDLVLLLNNDVSLHPQTISRLLSYFNDKKTFAVGCLENLPSGKKRGKSVGKFKRGLIIHSKAKNLHPGNTFWVFAASGLFRRDIWNLLGGLDPIYRPAYWEDIDICYRATKIGYNCLFEPQAKVNHDSEATMSHTLGRKVQMIAFKNQLLFFWKNVSDSNMFLHHLFWLPYHLLITTTKTKGAFLAGFIWALSDILNIDRSLPSAPVRRDKEILELT